MGWNYLSIPKLQRLHPTLYRACDYLLLGLKLNQVVIKDNFGRVRIIKTYDDLFRYKQTTGRDVNVESGEQSTTDRRWTQFSGRLEHVYLSGKTCLLIQKSGITASCAVSLYLVTWHIYTNRSTSHLVINYFHAIFISVCPYILEYMYIQWGAVMVRSISCLCLTR